jgi:ethanolaminephosphotransferase
MLIGKLGVDAINTSLEVLLFSACMNLGQGWKTVAVQFARISPQETYYLAKLTYHNLALFTFYVQTWDEYHTKTLTLGVMSGSVEGILTLCVVYAITAILGGGSFWQQSMLHSIGISNNNGLVPNALYDLAWNEWYIIYGGIILVFNTWWR